MDPSIIVAFIGIAALVVQDRLARRREGQIRQAEIDRAQAERDEVRRHELDLESRKRAAAREDAWRTERLTAYRDFRVAVDAFRRSVGDVRKAPPGHEFEASVAPLIRLREVAEEVMLVGGPEVSSLADEITDRAFREFARAQVAVMPDAGDETRRLYAWVDAADELIASEDRFLAAARKDLGTAPM